MSRWIGTLLLSLCALCAPASAQERPNASDALAVQGSLATTGLPAYRPPSGRDRLQWVVLSTVGPKSLAAGVFSAGFGTLFNLPSEYGTHWEGFGKRYGMRLTGISTGNVIEAGLGAAWGEDPRYRRSGQGGFGNRIGHAVKMTFFDKSSSGGTMPAYARYAAIGGNNFLSNSWRADSEATTSRASLRIMLGFLGRMGSNLFEEFWPDLTERIFDRNTGGRMARAPK
jgi:hypothetical protein